MQTFNNDKDDDKEDFKKTIQKNNHIDNETDNYKDNYRNNDKNKYKYKFDIIRLALRLRSVGGKYKALQSLPLRCFSIPKYKKNHPI